MDRARILIIGGGVVGCAVAHAVSRRWQDVFLVEQLPRLGMATSSRNSGVIHSGIYYPPGTLKAQLGAEIVTHARVEALEPQRDSIRVTLRIGDDATAKHETIEADCVVNAAGLYADDVAAMLGNRSWRIYPVRGEFCEIRGPRAALVNGLVYPLPLPEGFLLGVHFTKTLWGTLLVGPTGTYVEGKDNYERNRLPISYFARSAKALLPEIEESDLQLSYSGLRPKLVPPGGKGPFDFVITRDPHVPQVIQLGGMESPGLTAAPSIAERVASLVAETFT